MGAQHNLLKNRCGAKYETGTIHRFYRLRSTTAFVFRPKIMRSKIIASAVISSTIFKSTQNCNNQNCVYTINVYNIYAN